MPRFVHAADLHLDSPLRNLDLKDAAPGHVLRAAPRRALEALVALCIEEKVDFLLLAGDIYDGDWKDSATGQFFCQQMRELKEIPVFLIRGNHDAANKMTTSLPLPKNVRIFSGKKAETHVLKDLQVAIHGQSFQDQEARENLVRDYPAPVSGWHNIGLLHTSLEGNKSHGTYAPCSVEQLVNKGYDYWALGHIHQRQVVRDGAPAIVFPGNIQGRHVRETGEKGAYLVTLGGPKPELEFRRLDVARWEVIEHRADPSHERDELLGAVVGQVRMLVAREQERSLDPLLVVRCQIHGESAAHAALQARTIEATDDFRELLRNDFDDVVWLESVRFETSPLSESASEFDDATGELQAVIAEFAADHEKLKAVADSLNVLKDKLPPALVNGDDALNPTDPDWLAGLLGRVLPVLTDAGAKGDKS